jgi:hypothetical protein
MEPRASPLLDEGQQLCNIVAKSVVTAKAGQQIRSTKELSSPRRFAFCILDFSMLYSASFAPDCRDVELDS